MSPSKRQRALGKPPSVEISPIAPMRLKDIAAATDPYDAVIGTLGYERRSARIPAALATTSPRVYLVDLASPGQASYDVNRAEIGEECELIEASPRSLASWIDGLVETIATNSAQSVVRVAFDVSSISRDRMAYLVEGLAGLGRHRSGGRRAFDVSVDFMYTPAKWRKPGTLPRLTEVLGPVTSEYAGIPANPETPVIAFVGLGFEPDRAVGALEYIEPGDIWAFAPGGEDERYDRAMRTANAWLFRMLRTERVVDYAVADPFGCFVALEQLVFSELSSGRPILVPLGPKMFAVNCLLVATAHHRRVGVWRVASGVYGEPVDHESAGKVIAVRAVFGR